MGNIGYINGGILDSLQLFVIPHQILKQIAEIDNWALLSF